MPKKKDQADVDNMAEAKDQGRNSVPDKELSIPTLIKVKVMREKYYAYTHDKGQTREQPEEIRKWNDDKKPENYLAMYNFHTGTIDLLTIGKARDLRVWKRFKDVTEMNKEVLPSRC